MKHGQTVLASPNSASVSTRSSCGPIRSRTPSCSWSGCWIICGACECHCQIEPWCNRTSGSAITSRRNWIGQRPRAVPIHNDHLEIARAAWAAWRAPTPAAWFDLLAQDLSAVPQLRNTVIALLEELPMRSSGLGATEMRMLQLLAEGHVHPYDLFPGHEKPNERRTYGYWEVGELLDGLARCPAPAVSGLVEGPFDDALHDSTHRHDRYRNSRLSLTDLGKAILAQADDFSRHNPIHRWWGGTELTNDRLWRWDPDSRTLIAP